MCSPVTLCHPERERGALGVRGARLHTALAPRSLATLGMTSICYAGRRVDLHLTLGTRGTTHFFQASQQSETPVSQPAVRRVACPSARRASLPDRACSSASRAERCPETSLRSGSPPSTMSDLSAPDA